MTAKCTTCGRRLQDTTQTLCHRCRDYAERRTRRRAAPGPPAREREIRAQAHRAAEREINAAEAKVRFITELINNGGQVEKACKAAGVSRDFVGKHRDADSDFATAWESVQELNVERLETEADRRALGYPEPVFYQGKPTGHQVTRYSDNLLMFRLKALRPEKYRDGPGVKPGDQLSEEELNAALTKMMARRQKKDAPDIDAELTM
jgi:hypothetical protein